MPFEFDDESAIMEETFQGIVRTRMEDGVVAMASLFDLPDITRVAMADKFSNRIYTGSAQIERGQSGVVRATVPSIQKLDYQQLLSLTDYLSGEKNNPLVCDVETAQVIGQDPNSTLLFTTIHCEEGPIYPMGLVTRKKDGKLLGALQLFIASS